MRALSLDRLNLGAACFESGVSFRDVEFGETVLMPAVRFEGGVTFSDSVFRRGLLGGGCYLGDALISKTDVGTWTLFKFEATMLSIVDAKGSRLEFTDGQIVQALGLQRSDIRSVLWSRMRAGGAVVTDTSMKAAIIDISAAQEVKFEACQFTGAARLDLASGGVGLWISASSFVERPTLRLASATSIDMRGNQFFEGVDAQVGAGSLALDSSDFRRPSVISAAGGPEAPRMVSARKTDLLNLTLDDVDLSECRFAGAHNLDKLRFNGAMLFGDSPRGWRWLPWPTRLSRRRVILEEADWRSRCGRRWSNLWPTIAHPDWLRPEEQLEPPDIADLYRRLRKAREDDKDEPGAADFYYGEMEMRRLTSGAPRGERLILGFYWALAGYGLRASRALIALAVLTAAFSFVLWKVGFAPVQHHGPDYWRAMTYALGAATLHPPSRKLTTLGEGLTIAFRVIGPVLLGLALLSIRGRVRR